MEDLHFIDSDLAVSSRYNVHQLIFLAREGKKKLHLCEFFEKELPTLQFIGSKGFALFSQGTERLGGRLNYFGDKKIKNPLSR